MNPIVQTHDDSSTESPELQSPMFSWSTDAILQCLDIAFRNQLTTQSPIIDQPPEITVPLRAHQKALIAAMEQREMSGVTGIPYKNTLTYTNYGILGDTVGAGKSLVVLGYLAYVKHKPTFPLTNHQLFQKSRANFFTVCTRQYTEQKLPALIVVPHTIYRQWVDYCKKQTTLNIMCIKNQKDIQPFFEGNLEAHQTILQTMRDADAVLVSNTLYAEIQYIARVHRVEWSRIFVDEVDTIHIPGTQPPPNGRFTWFISASWPNFLLEGIDIRPLCLGMYQERQNQYSAELGDWLRAEIGTAQYQYGLGRVTRMHCRSQKWLYNYYSDHVLRGMTLLHCHASFLEESRSMPPIVYQTLRCAQPAYLRAVTGIVGASILNMLHGGNVEGALEELGVPADTPMNIVEAVTLAREKELDRLHKTLVFKESIEYATPQAKEQALDTLKAKIQSVEEQLRVIRERLVNVQQETCPVCYEDPNATSGTITPCCHRIFCASCILQSLARQMSCPLCRAKIQPSQLTQLVKEKKDTPGTNAPKTLSKSKQLLEFLRTNPTARVLIFSRYDNPFEELERECDTEGISYHTLRGNKDVVASTIKSFEKGEKRVLFLPTASAGAGINLVGATHCVLYHAMTPEEEKQCIGRAYRLGRTEPLTVVRLLHENESLGL
jgi:SNF2 family DNA or RNA helicase